jgi:hypothetical protein
VEPDLGPVERREGEVGFDVVDRFHLDLVDGGPLLATGSVGGPFGALTSACGDVAVRCGIASVTVVG